jgi:hypothetical protein
MKTKKDNVIQFINLNQCIEDIKKKGKTSVQGLNEDQIKKIQMFLRMFANVDTKINCE